MKKILSKIKENKIVTGIAAIAILGVVFYVVGVLAKLVIMGYNSF